MEKRRHKKAGVLFRTPATGCTSPASTEMSEDAQEDEDEEQSQREDDFGSQMDENGIIGLTEALEDVQLGETCGDTHPDCELPGCSPHRTPEREGPMGCLGDLQHEELNYNLSGHLYCTEPAGGDLQAWSSCESRSSRDDMVKHRTRNLFNDDKCMEKEDKEEGTERDRNDKKHQFAERLGHFGATATLAEGYISNRHNEEMSSKQSCCGHLSGLGPSGHYCQDSQSASPVTASFWPQRFHVTAEELAAARGIDAETFPEMSFSERHPESNCSYSGSKSSSRCEEINHRASPLSAASFSEQVISNHHSRLSNGATEESDKHHNGTPSPGKSRKLSPEASVETNTSISKQQSKAGNDGAKVDGSRKGFLSFHTPDFSRVEPKVRFPRDGYKPPRSKRSSTMKSLSPELPLEQLQEDYNRLLTKLAEAENTIDRLRLEAKVNLYSDLPKPSHSVHSGLKDNASKFLKLDLSQLQRAEISSTSLHPNGLGTQQGSSDACPSTRGPDIQLGKQLSDIIFDLAGKFLQQMQAFEDLLKSEKLNSFEKTKGLAQLTKDLDSLETGYLLARDEHKLLQQRGVETSHFDPGRELEGLIFQCGVRMEELKEQVEQPQHEQPASEAFSSPTLQSSPSFDSCDGGEMLFHPLSPILPSLVDPGKEAKIAKRSNKEEVQDEETLHSPDHRPQTTSIVQDFTEPVDNQRRFKELSKNVPHSATLKCDMQHGDKEEEQQAAGDIRRVVWRTTSPSNPQHTSSSPPLVSQSTMLPVLLPRSRRRLWSPPSSSQSSLADITASQKQSSKDDMGSKRVLSQDGIVSPETDSGFVGSETSHLPSAAAPGLLHQRASESVSISQEGSSRRCETGPAAASPPPPTVSHRPIVQKHRVDSQPGHRPSRRTRQGQWRNTQQQINHTEPKPASSGSSEFGPESDNIHTGSEVEHSDPYATSVNSLRSSHTSFSPAALCHHGDSLRAQRSGPAADYNEAMQEVLALKAEVTKLQEKVDSLVGSENRPSAVTPAPAQQNCSHHDTSTPHIWRQKSEVNQGWRKTKTVDGVEDDFAQRATTKERSVSAQTQTPLHDILRSSDVEFSEAKPQPAVSRCTQTSVTSGSFYPAVFSQGTQTRQHPMSETAYELDSRAPSPRSLHCLSSFRGHDERGGDREQMRPSSCCHRGPAADSHKRDASTQLHSPPAKPPDGAAGSRYVGDATPTTLLHCMPVYTPQLLLYSGSLDTSPNKSTDASSGLRSTDVRRRRRKTRTSLSVEEDSDLGVSLSRAVRAAQHMKHTARHMADSMAMGL
ncbi:microtubule organization protein AKNA [Cololabis saira]|uniref:microtubule organization protein AKNA n=1 Tax=Cololabis saira TaxID=129043 RepID=UPI002AD38064|nr:microtubule organization protein AKNA [Cololabis saira]